MTWVPAPGTGVSVAWVSASCNAGPEPTYLLWDSKSEIGFLVGWDAVLLGCSWSGLGWKVAHARSRVHRALPGVRAGASSRSDRRTDIFQVSCHARQNSVPPYSSPSRSGKEDRRVWLAEEPIAQSPTLRQPRCPGGLRARAGGGCGAVCSAPRRSFRSNAAAGERAGDPGPGLSHLDSHSDVVWGS